MIYFISIFCLIVIIGITAKIFFYSKFRYDVKRLFEKSARKQETKFTYDQLHGLPDPVKRYFRLVLKEGTPYINCVRLKHEGYFKTKPSGTWNKINGLEYFTTSPPGFLWKGVTSHFTAIDGYVADKGHIAVSIYSLLPILNAGGSGYDQGALLRWLGESIWFPTSLLPGKYLQWSAIDQFTAKLNFHYNNLHLYYIVSFNTLGEIIQMETKRYYNGSKLETWLGRFTNYRAVNGILLPVHIEAIWKLQEGEYSYARFILKMVEYNKARPFPTCNKFLNIGQGNQY